MPCGSGEEELESVPFIIFAYIHKLDPLYAHEGLGFTKLQIFISLP
jgi:hypothetical protein